MLHAVGCGMNYMARKGLGALPAIEGFNMDGIRFDSYDAGLHFSDHEHD